MSKLKKKVSKTVFASFFIFQFIVSTAFMPVVLNAEDMADVSNNTVSEEASSTEVSEVSEQPTIESETQEQEESPVSENSSEPKNSTEVESVAGGNNGGGHTQVQICHASGQSGNFQVLTVDDDGTFVGHGNHANDIIPITDLNGDGIINSADCTYTPTQGQYVDGVLKVCKVIIDERGNIVSDWSAYEDSYFGTKLTLQGSEYLFNFGPSDSLSGGYNFSTVCKTQNVSVNVSVISGLLYVKYDEETIDGTTPFVANYFENDATGETGLYNAQGGAMFDEFTTSDTAYDGQFELNGNPSTGFSGTLFLVNEEQKGVTPSCDASVNLFANGGFENPVVGGNWNIYPNGTPSLGWDVNWQPGSGNGPAANLEIHAGVNGWQAFEGNQYAELDSDFDGPGGSINNEAGQVKISQTINTIPGQTYTITFAFAGRPGTAIEENVLQLYIDDVAWGTPRARGNLNGTQPNWITLTNTFTAVKNQTTISFADVSDFPNSFGTLLDNVSVKCVDDNTDPNTNPTITVNPVEVCLPTSATSYDFMSGVTANDAEDGNLTSSVVVEIGNFVLGVPGVYTITYTVTDSDKNPVTATRTITIKDNCSETPSCEANGNEIWAKITLTNVVSEGAGDLQSRIYVGSNSTYINSGEWFMVHDGTNAVVDATLFENVPGVAVQRVNGKVRFGIHGSHPERKPYAYERVVGTIEFFQGDITTWENDLSDNNKVDVTGVAVPDTVSVANNVLSFDLGVDIADDFLYAPYVFNPCDDDNGGGEDDLVVQIPNACVARGTENFDIFSGLSVSYLGSSVDLNDVVKSANPTNIDINTNGTYTVTYTIEYAGITETVERTIEVKTRCTGGGGGGGSSSGGSSRSEGEVLGATSCVAFTTYNRLGNKGGEIKALQTFLNEYMNAGLTVDGVYGRTTAQAVHDFQAFHWKEVIDPWTPPLSPNTTGWQYKSTRATINAIIDCPEAPVFLEDPAIMYSVTEVENEKPFTSEQMQKIYDLLIEAQTGDVLGATTVNVDALDYSNPNYDLMFGK